MLAPTTAAPGGARAGLSAWLADEHADATLIEVSLLLVSELVTNSVRHATTAVGAQVHLTASFQATTLRIELSDGGVDGKVSRRPPSLEDGGGFGLDLVAALSSAWGVDRGPQGTTVWLELPVD
jgi:anti-sigma regulatory factor (Ser/Thr protein kinase)